MSTAGADNDNASNIICTLVYPVIIICTTVYLVILNLICTIKNTRLFVAAVTLSVRDN